MIVQVIYNNGCDYREFEYESIYNRINAKGIKEEIENKMLKKYNRIYEIVQFYRKGE